MIVEPDRHDGRRGQRGHQMVEVGGDGTRVEVRAEGVVHADDHQHHVRPVRDRRGQLVGAHTPHPGAGERHVEVAAGRDAERAPHERADAAPAPACHGIAEADGRGIAEHGQPGPG